MLGKGTELVAEKDSSSVDTTDLVSVIVPAYNAQRTVGETLRSVRCQTHKSLEIIVVDDGSTDGTAVEVQRHASEDPRVRLFSVPNGGVAAARNRGIALASGAFIAPIDADDLWLPTKIERQLRALKGRPHVGLVYTWFAKIDDCSRVTSLGGQESWSGDVLARMATINFVGNASSPLMRTECVQRAGGYDPSLQSRGAQGCEDWKLYIRIAEQSEFAVIPDYLTGYRQSLGAMSSDALRMLHSDYLVREEFLARRPEYYREARQGRNRFLEWSLWRSIEAGRWSEALTIAKMLFDESPRAGSRALQRALGSAVRRLPRAFLSLFAISRGAQPFLLETASEGGRRR